MFGNLKSFPKPKGSYVVGITQLDFLDRNRKGILDSTKDVCRKIPVKIYYPADSNENKSPAPYLYPEDTKVIIKSSFRLITQKNLRIKTHIYLNLPLSSKEENYPVIFYNHGYFSSNGDATVLCSDLASKGYIVLSLGHPYESSVVRYTDGTIIESSKQLYQEFKKTMSPSSKKKFKSLLENTYSDEEIIPVAADYYQNFKGTSVWNNVKIWAEDTRFVADQLSALNDGSISSIFENRLDLEPGYGITGHSYGGCVAAEVCLVDARFKCGVNLDAPTYGDYWDKDIKKPFMVIGSYIIENCTRSLYLNNSEDSYFIKIENTEHMDYCDYLFFARQLKVLGLIGKNDRDLVRDVISTYHLDFFDKYLQGNKKVDMNIHKFSGVNKRIRCKSGKM